ncbi:porin family protein [Fulvivirga ligni]|uniref:porin family protein n=1 Tax=Fulvivirga ligni TaxID=2904246 RepID=UPI001F1CCC5F|nr:porin family protein [Fulvivirga ligni]UII22186.1 PorT family protein [Fulvivirga ligni]
MRKKLLFLSFLFISIGSYAQVELGVKFSPTISTSRVSSDADDVNFDGNGAALRFAAGPFADIAFSENYYISTGLFLVSNRATFEVTSGPERHEEEHNLQYLQVPLALKLYTNEIALDKRIYFQVGTTMEFKVKEKSDSEIQLIEDFKLFNSTLQVGFGLDYKIGLNTSLFGGLSYNRGLINAVSERAEGVPKFTLKNDYVGIDLGIKF